MELWGAEDGIRESSFWSIKRRKWRDVDEGSLMFVEDSVLRGGFLIMFLWKEFREKLNKLDVILFLKSFKIF